MLDLTLIRFDGKPILIDPAEVESIGPDDDNSRKNECKLRTRSGVVFDLLGSQEEVRQQVNETLIQRLTPYLNTQRMAAGLLLKSGMTGRMATASSLSTIESTVTQRLAEFTEFLESLGASPNIEGEKYILSNGLREEWEKWQQAMLTRDEPASPAITLLPYQQRFVDCEYPLAALVGNGGGGKTTALIVAAITHCQIYSKAIASLWKCTYQELASPGGMMEQVDRMVRTVDRRAVFDKVNLRWTLSNRSTLGLFHWRTEDYTRGYRFSFVGIDDLEKFGQGHVRYLVGRCRQTDSRATSQVRLAAESKKTVSNHLRDWYGRTWEVFECGPNPHLNNKEESPTHSHYGSSEEGQ